MLPCFGCGDLLSPVWAEDPPGQQLPDGAVVFRAYGNFGSAVWDPPGVHADRWLEINVCDRCLRFYTARVDWVRSLRQVPLLEVQPFNPDSLEQGE